MTGPKTILEWALFYHSRGWSVVPVKHGRKKVPAVSWTQYQSVRADESQLRRWFDPSCGGRFTRIGIILGTVSGRLAVRDFDIGEKYDQWVEQYPEYARILPTVRTRRAAHVYLIVSADSPLTKTLKFTDGELRFEKSFVVAPPSLHSDNFYYKWIISLPPGDLPKLDPFEIGMIGPPAPSLRGKKAKTKGRIQEGQRNTALTSRAGSLRHRGASYEAILADLLEMNRDQCDPPLPADEVESIARSIGQYPLPTGNLPRIQINNRQLRDLVDDAWRAIQSNNLESPALFRRGGELVRIADSDDQLCIEPHHEASVVGHLARVADWIRINDKSTVSVTPPKDLAKDLLAYPSRCLPKLEAILRTPVFAADGELLHEDGYHPGHGLWLADVSSLDIPAIPQAPSRADISRARSLLCEELLGEFPFVDAADLAHTVAALLLPTIRRMIRGVTPLHVICAPIAGSGKGLLCDIISICNTGSPCPVQPISAKEEEIRKVITSQLSLARPIILLDNARERMRIDSASLAAALTAEVWTDRILSESRNATLPNRALWLLTGNNPQFSTELARRSVRTRIDPQRDQPWLRTGFRHRDLRAWALGNRAKLLGAMFVLVRAWQKEGCALSKVELGTFERWSQIVGGVLMVAEIPGFLTNLDDFYANSDDEGQMWRDFVRAWWDKYGSIPKRVSELLLLCEEQDLMIATRSDGAAKSQETKLGIAIRRACDRVYAGRKITLSKDGGGRGKLYQLIPVKSPETANGVTSESHVEPLNQGYTPGYTNEDQATDGVPSAV